jgi:hypothetical protein
MSPTNRFLPVQLVDSGKWPLAAMRTLLPSRTFHTLDELALQAVEDFRPNPAHRPAAAAKAALVSLFDRVEQIVRREPATLVAEAAMQLTLADKYGLPLNFNGIDGDDPDPDFTPMDYLRLFVIAGVLIRARCYEGVDERDLAVWHLRSHSSRHDRLTVSWKQSTLLERFSA